ncbi:MAG: S49 family peptidase [Haloarculaceae archaeon]
MTSNGLTGRRQLVAVVLVAAVIGVALWPVATDAADRPTDTVAVVEIDGPVVSSLADDVEQELSDIRQNDSVKAVVLKMNTPGGSASASERMYMSVQRTAKEMPVVASVQQVSASGGYYAMLPTDNIYVLPTSFTGSVGLAANAPQPSAPVRGPSGPDKRGGNTIEGWALRRSVADTFVTTVMEQRGDEIQVSRSEVAHAKIYLGTEAVQNGFADKLGSKDAAIREAAERAGLDSYQVDTRQTGWGGLPLLFQANGQVLAIESNDPGYKDVRPVRMPLVHEGSIPHIESVEAVTQDEIRSNSQSEQPDATDSSLEGGVSG